MPAKREWADEVVKLSAEGNPVVEIARTLREQFGLGALAALRHARQWSQDDAAPAWNARWPEQPRTFKHFSYWETGHYTPTLKTFDKLVQLYECNLDDLLADRPGYGALAVTYYEGLSYQALTLAGDQPIRRVWQRAGDIRRALGPASKSSTVRPGSYCLEVTPRMCSADDWSLCWT